MPGYRTLLESVSGPVADLTREAAALEHDGERERAVEHYERALVQAIDTEKLMPDFVCGRLAHLYRQMGRHQDEVSLLERYQAAHSDDESRVRFVARLSKARTLLEKAQRLDDVGA